MSRLVAEHQFPSEQTLALVQGDLTRAGLDAIVNAANAQLQHGGGLAAAIVRRGGSRIQRESKEWVRANGPARHDRPAVTGAGDLPCRYLIHAVGPVWGEGDEDRKLSTAVTASLETAESLRASSLGLPAISTGIFGFPKERAAPVILEAVAHFFETNPRSGLRRVELTILDEPTLKPFERAFSLRFPPAPPTTPTSDPA